MKSDNHSVVYFINEEYGVVIRESGATREVAVWEGETGGFTRRIDAETAEFLQHTDRFGGAWCVAHPTYSRVTAEKAAKAMDGATQRSASLPNGDGMVLAKAAKREALRTELREKGAERMVAEITARWHEREALYAGM